MSIEVGQFEFGLKELCIVFLIIYCIYFGYRYIKYNHNENKKDKKERRNLK